jgi:hypothetical protein
MRHSENTETYIPLSQQEIPVYISMEFSKILCLVVVLRKIYNDHCLCGIIALAVSDFFVFS